MDLPHHHPDHQNALFLQQALDGVREFGIVSELFDLRPQAIIQNLNLRRPIYKQTAAYGHFGRNDLDLPWEKLDKVEDLKVAAAKASV